MPAAEVTLPPALRDLLAAMKRAVPDAYLVGGAVRDLLLGKTPADLDYATATDSHAAAEAIAASMGGTPFVLDGERGVWRVLLPEAAPVREIDVSFAADLDADLRRRDFTINALAARINDDGSISEIVDVCDGLRDVNASVLRLVSEPALRDDPLRMLRAVRLATEHGLVIEEATAEAIRETAALLPQAAAERQRDELVRILATDNAIYGLRLADALGLLSYLMPELEPMRGVSQPPNHHYYDVFDHSLQALAALDGMLDPLRAQQPPRAWKSDAKERHLWLPQIFRQGLDWYEVDAYLDGRVGAYSRRVLLKLAGLVHDVSKPETRSVEADGKVRFLGHPELGAAKADAICRRLRFGSRETAFIARLVEEHLRPMMLSNRGLPSRRAIFRFARDLGDAAPACLFLSLADASAAAGPRLTPEHWAARIAYIAFVLQNCEAEAEVIATTPRLVTGNDLMSALGLQPGPIIGKLLQEIDEAWAQEEISDRDEALAYAARLADEWNHGESG